MFRGIGNLTINGGSFVQNTNLPWQRARENPGVRPTHPGRELLTSAASPNSFYNSAANQVSKHNAQLIIAEKETSQTVATVLNWISNSDHELLMWLSGDYREGRVLIAQSIAKWCFDEHIPFATFFFSNRDSSRNSAAEHLIPTIAYGITQSLPTSQYSIWDAVESDPHIFSRSLETQFENVILDPLNKAALNYSGRPLVIIMEGLDECFAEEERTTILQLFGGTKYNLYDVPWKILICSASEKTISEAFTGLRRSTVRHVMIPAPKNDRLHRSTTSSSSRPRRNMTPIRHVGNLGRNKSSGLRVLSIDGGGIRCLSALVILQVIMYQIQQTRELDHPPKPCEMFDLAGGTGTGGLIVIMLFRLEMSIDEAIRYYISLARTVFSKKKPWPKLNMFSASLFEEELIKILSEKLGISREEARGVPMLDESKPKCFVCAMSEANLTSPIPFYTWQPHTLPLRCTILQAARATCAAPNIFKGIGIDVLNIKDHNQNQPGILKPNGPSSTSVKLTFSGAGWLCNNPVRYVLEEANQLNPHHTTGRQVVSCVLSLGTGLPHVLKLAGTSKSKNPFSIRHRRDVTSTLGGIAEDCERTADDMARQFQGLQDEGGDIYFRLNVDRGMEDVAHAEWDKFADVTVHTKQYLKRHDVVRKLDRLVSSLARPRTS